MNIDREGFKFQSDMKHDKSSCGHKMQPALETVTKTARAPTARFLIKTLSMMAMVVCSPLTGNVATETGFWKVIRSHQKV